MPVYTIYHNPRCSKSRQTLQLLKDNGIEPEVVLYLETPPNANQLKNLLKKLDIPARQLLRKGEQDYKDLGLADQNLTDEQLIDAMLKAPKLIERPIVEKGDKAILGRPPENALELI
ncbi:glutaredoxin-dependent arsenate reductase [Spongiibacter sp. IMCC21906]|jgi:arsenate reductase|uniref:arsenate reductase (glutaredoxin) n=1 Tax=Spongiibacter sp. IMCC21906 TaxID=1620392 RepID=UPI00062DF31A|nr:arsenate reductase (glutaredoxin) [Spongiibacter sp. IMCC21906]AKH69049.1 glutaredoxin-dependent arsenate reductase [Spongiibacter sp. IMCC21906]